MEVLKYGKDAINAVAKAQRSHGDGNQRRQRQHPLLHRKRMRISNRLRSLSLGQAKMSSRAIILLEMRDRGRSSCLRAGERPDGGSLIESGQTDNDVPDTSSVLPDTTAARSILINLLQSQIRHRENSYLVLSP